MPIRDDSQQQGSSRQHPVPQNVMDVEFKVVGDLTVRQLMYLFAGGVLIYVFHRSGLPGFWRVTLMAITGITAIAVAFVPIEERGLDKWLVSFIKAMFAPSQMIWRKTYSPPAYFISDYAQIIKNEIITLTPAKSRNKLEDYLGQLPEAQTDLDKLEISRIKDIQSGFSKPMAASIPQPTMQQPQSISDISLSETTTTTIEAPEVITIPETEQKPASPETKDDSSWIAYDDDNSQNDDAKKQADKKKDDEAKKAEQLKKEKARKEAEQHEMQAKMELLRAIEKNKPTFKNQAIDRAIVNVPAELKGEIRIKTTTKLPKTIVFQDIKKIETKEDLLSKKLSELLAVTRKVRTDMQQNIAQGKDVQEVKDQHQGRVEFFKSKYKELEQEQAKVSSQIDQSTSRVEQVATNNDQNELKSQVQDLMVRNEELKAQLAQIRTELSAIKNPTQPVVELPEQQTKIKYKDAHEETQEQEKTIKQTEEPEIYHEPDKQNTQEDPSETHVLVQTQHDSGHPDQKPQEVRKSVSPFQYDPNVIHGTVKNKASELVEGAVVIIKDKDGDAIRALKTNQLGQFKTQTPLQDGVYTVEAIKGGSKFDIISVEAKGQQLKPLQIIAYG